MAKATIKEVEVEKVVKVKEKIGVTLELTPREANLLFFLCGRTYAPNIREQFEIYNALSSVCKDFDEDIPIRYEIPNSFISEYLNTPLK